MRPPAARELARKIVTHLNPQELNEVTVGIVATWIVMAAQRDEVEKEVERIEDLL